MKIEKRKYMDLSQNIGMENTRAILREPDVHQTINYLMLELSASGNIQFLQFHPVSVEQIKRMKPELLADSETFIKPYPPHRQTLGSTQTFFSENKKYELSGEQRKALEAHRAHLQARWTEYHILSYLFFCFSRGYSRTEKIQEINNLLATGEAKAEVVEQGHTGSIVLGMR
ncbi:hypothetical protein [Legionella maceachernii]|nr:hypothetical protein [Legionella maceachernii]